MLFEDSNGKLFTEEQIDELSAWELEDKGIHLAYDLDNDIHGWFGLN
jgi:hypothetical protein